MSNKLVTVEAYSTVWEAEVAGSLLASEGVPVTLLDGETVNMNWLWSNAVGGVKVQVPEEDLDRARDLLAASPNMGCEEAMEGVNCPRCQNRYTRVVLRKRRWTYLTWLLCGVPLIWPSRRLKCDRCGYTWKDVEG